MEGVEDFNELAQGMFEDLYPGTLGIGATTYAVARGGEEWELERQRGGYEDESEARVRVRMSLLPERPAKRTACTLDGRAYFIDDASRRVGEDVWILSLKRR